MLTDKSAQEDGGQAGSTGRAPEVELELLLENTLGQGLVGFPSGFVRLAPDVVILRLICA